MTICHIRCQDGISGHPLFDWGRRACSGEDGSGDEARLVTAGQRPPDRQQAPHGEPALDIPYPDAVDTARGSSSRRRDHALAELGTDVALVVDAEMIVRFTGPTLRRIF